MNKPEALRLAEYLEQDPCSKAHHDEAAAELRRLHAQRDALLEALKSVTSATDLATYGAALHEARAVIKAAEETK